MQDLTVAQLIHRLVPKRDPLSLPPSKLLRLEEIVNLHNEAVEHSRCVTLDQARQLLWPEISQAGGLRYE
jgi:hypothetical protein